jgi:hypothetical protein
VSKKPLELVAFFIDRSLGGKLIATALRDAGANVEVHDSHFKPDTPDVDWLTEVGKRGWWCFRKMSGSAETHWNWLR